MMELEFDKEIDAILRKAQAPAGAAVSAVPSAHLDADAVAAFAENALPQRAQQLYTEHFADCDRCRKLLSKAILTNTEAVATTGSSVAAPSLEAVTPWYDKFFRTPNLALAMGALALAFSGVLGYLALQNRNSSNNADVALVTEPEKSNGGSSYSGESSASASNSKMAAANTMANSANMPSANLSALPSAVSNAASNSTANAMGRADSARIEQLPINGRNTETLTLDGVTTGATKPASAAPPTPVGQPLTDRDERKAGDNKEKLKDDARERAMSKTEATDLYSRNSLSNAKKTGPNRASGPRNVQQQEMNTRSVAGMIVPTKTTGGKTFESRNGAWYDTAYHGQATTNVRRGTDTYNKLDGGLRSIANSISDTVVVVWKAKAYRIQ